jgi:hypothetical protein
LLPLSRLGVEPELPDLGAEPQFELPRGSGRAGPLFVGKVERDCPTLFGPDWPKRRNPLFELLFEPLFERLSQPLFELLFELLIELWLEPLFDRLPQPLTEPLFEPLLGLVFSPLIEPLFPGLENPRLFPVGPPSIRRAPEICDCPRSIERGEAFVPRAEKKR